MSFTQEPEQLKGLEDRVLARAYSHYIERRKEWQLVAMLGSMSRTKDKLDVAVLGKKRTWQVNNAREGIACLVEATGGYQRAVVEALFHAGLCLAVVNPARVRQFARADGLLAKTDKLDAFVLAEFGETMQPRRYEGKTDTENS